MSPQMTTVGISEFAQIIVSNTLADVAAGASLSVTNSSLGAIISAEVALNVEFESLQWDAAFAQMEDPSGVDYSPNANSVPMLFPTVPLYSSLSRIRNSAGAPQQIRLILWRHVSA